LRKIMVRQDEVLKMLIERLEKVSSASIYSSLWELGYRNCWMEDIHPISLSNVHVVGAAVTVKYLPFKKEVGDEKYRNVLLQIVGVLRKGNVIVMGACGTKVGIIGDCIASGFKAKGASAVIIDGGVRDVPLIRKIGLPVFAKYATPAHIGEKVIPVEVNVTINCGGVQVDPGDIIVADDDGVMVIPKEVAKDATELGWKHECLDEESRKRILKGIPLGEAYPPKEEWLK
jgi:regulator of RNase E activity RraA